MVASNTGNKSGNNIEAVLCRLAGEIAYTSKRLCVRNENPYIALCISQAAEQIERAINFVNNEKDKEDARTSGNKEIESINSETGC